jgi:hypothetical protein
VMVIVYKCMMMMTIQALKLVTMRPMARTRAVNNFLHVSNNYIMVDL